MSITNSIAKANATGRKRRGSSVSQHKVPDFRARINISRARLAPHLNGAAQKFGFELLPATTREEPKKERKLYLQGIHNRRFFEFRGSQDDDFDGDIIINRFEAEMLSAPLEAVPKSYRVPSASAKPRQTSKAWTFKNAKPTKDPLQAELDELTDRFSQLSLGNFKTITPTYGDPKKRRALREVEQEYERFIARGKKRTSLDRYLEFDASIEQYEKNLMRLLHDFALKARHDFQQYGIWPQEKVEKAAMKLKKEVKKLYHKGVREDDRADFERSYYWEEESNYMRELDWFWRYHGLFRTPKLQKIFESEQRIYRYMLHLYCYSAGRVRVADQTDKPQRGVDFEIIAPKKKTSNKK